MTETPDDPRLSAYALGELDPAEQPQVEALLATDEAARQYVADLRATAADLRAELALESSPGLDAARRAAIFAEETSAVPALHLHTDEDSDARTDVYHVITHPSPRARRDFRELLAIAAAVAIVATTLTLILSSLFHSRGPQPASVAVDPSTTQPVPFILPPMRSVAEKGPDLPDGFSSRPPRELIAPFGTDAEAAAPFGLSGPISVARIQVPATGESGGAVAAYALTLENPFVDAAHHPLSSFSYNAAGSAYAAVRRALDQKQLPDKDAVRIEQLVNFFPYDYAAPTNGDAFAAHIEVAPCPWQPAHRLVRIGLKARDLPATQPVAEDLQVRVEFNPARVGAYRLIGYDRRLLTRAWPSDPRARHPIAAGQSVTALYELTPADEALHESPLKYQDPPQLTSAAKGNELLTVQLQFVDAASIARSESFAATDPGDASPEPTGDFKFAAAVAGFGLLLRDSPHKGAATYDLILTLAQAGQRTDVLGERAKFLDLIRQAQHL